MNLDEIFSQDGFLSKASASYESRPGQVALARLVDQAIREGSHALGEGPCGTGKGIAYSAPAILHAHGGKRRVVIATSGIALSDQLVKKDLPALLAALPEPFTFRVLKGRSNYICHEKLGASLENGAIDRKRHLPILDWRDRTETGDVAELDQHPGDAVWSLMSTTADDCSGEACPFIDECFYERAKDNADKSDIIVTNHHVLAAHLALRQETEMDLVLPGTDIVIVDEAHELPNVLRQFFGFSLTEKGMSRLAHRVAGATDDLGWVERIERRSAELFARALAFIREHGETVETVRLRLMPFDLKPLLRTLGAALEVVADKEKLHGETRAGVRAKKVKLRVERVIEHITEAFAQGDHGKVYFIEKVAGRKTYARIVGRPIEVGGIARHELFEKSRSVILTSATLTTIPGDFSFIRSELGVPSEALELAVPSPFDLERQALLVVPFRSHVPDDPNDPGFMQAFIRLLDDVMVQAGGRTLALFTSYKNLEQAYQGLRESHEIIRQERHGGLSRMEIIRRFRQEEKTSLFGTDAFWTGIDVPGPSLSVVVIDKIPFEPPGDPLSEAMKELDKKKFWRWYFARATLKLKQGVGRLIRSRTDVGAVVICDRRLYDQSYGQDMLRALRPLHFTRSTSRIGEFLQTAPVAVAETRKKFDERAAQMVLRPKRPPLRLKAPVGIF